MRGKYLTAIAVAATLFAAGCGTTTRIATQNAEQAAIESGNFKVGKIERSRARDKAELQALSSRPRAHGDPIQIDAEVFQLVGVEGVPMTVAEAMKQVSAGSAETIAKPLLVAHAGNWASFESVLNVTYPTAYDPPTVPEAIAGSVSSGDASGAKLKTNPGDVAMPAFPRDFEGRDIGLKLKFRPRAAADGSLSVECDIERTTLEGFVARGQPVVMTKVKKFSGRKKRVTLLENHQAIPAFLQQTERIVFAEKGGAIEPELVDPASTKVELKPRLEGFAAAISQPGLPPLLVTLSARKIVSPAPEKKTPPGKGARIFVRFHVVGIEWEKGQATATLPTPFAAILTNPQFEVSIRALNVTKGVDLLSAPSVLLRDSQPGKIEVMREVTYPASYDPPVVRDSPATSDSPAFPAAPATPKAFSSRSTGVACGVMARVLEDGSIELTLKPELSKFSQFLNFGEPIKAWKKDGIGKETPLMISENRMTTPVFQSQSVETTVRIPDGGVVVLGGLPISRIQQGQEFPRFWGELPLVGGLFQRDVEYHTRGRVYFFVGAKVIDPAG